MECYGVFLDPAPQSLLGPGGTWALSHGRKPVDRRHGKHTSPGGATEVRRTKRNCIALYVCPIRQALQSAAPPGLMDFLLLFSTGLRPRCSTQVASLDLRHRCGHASPQRGRTCQPRASPWVRDAQDQKALKGRNKQSIPNVPFIKLRDDGDSRTWLLRPFRASTLLCSDPQGVALG